MLGYISIDPGEDEPWAPTSIVFALIGAQCAQLGPDSTVCDLGAGAAVSSIAIARRTGSLVEAVDSSSAAIASMIKRAEQYGVAERLLPVQMDAIEYLRMAGREGKIFDLILAEGGISGAVGHKALLREASKVIRKSGVLVLSGYAYNGTSLQPQATDSILANVPADVVEHHERTRHAKNRREILIERDLLRLAEAEGFAITLNCRSGQNHWSSYFDRMHQMSASRTGVALVYGSTERQIGIDEAFHNLRSQKYLSYAVVIATRHAD